MLKIQDAKNRHFGTIAPFCRAVSSQLRHVLTIGKKLVKQQYIFHVSSTLQPNFAALNRRRHLYSTGRPSRWALAHILVLSSSIFYLFPGLISAVADLVSAILPHTVWPCCKFTMQVWNVRHAARWKYNTQRLRKKSPSGHHRTTLSGYIFTTKARIDNR